MPGNSLQASHVHLLAQASYSQFIQFSNSGQTGSTSSNKRLKCCKEFSFQYNGLLYCRACVSNKALHSTLCEGGKLFFTRHIADINTHRAYKYSECSNSDQIIVVLKRSSDHKRYPPQVQHPLRITSCTSSRGQFSLSEHSLRKQGHVRVRRCKFLSNTPHFAFTQF